MARTDRCYGSGVRRRTAIPMPWSRAGIRVFTFGLLAGALSLAGESCSTSEGDVADASSEGRTSTYVPAAPRAGSSSGAGPSDAFTGDDGGSLDAAPLLDADDDLDASDDSSYLKAGAPCEDAGRDCAPGFGCCTGCCLAGRPRVCARLVGGAMGPECPLPDLTVVRDRLLGYTVTTVEAGTCELEEQCLAGSGARRVIRFDVWIANEGTADLVLGVPALSDGFLYASCHGHYHFSDFANYALVDDAGATVVVGRKQAFCARDSVRSDPRAQLTPRYDCERQGLSRGWVDIYAATLPCQWLDITGVPPGTYQLEIDVNPARVMTESNYDNNRASVPIRIE
jgi:hypothetical protein